MSIMAREVIKLKENQVEQRLRRVLFIFLFIQLVIIYGSRYSRLPHNFTEFLLWILTGSIISGMLLFPVLLSWSIIRKYKPRLYITIYVVMVTIGEFLLAVLFTLLAPKYADAFMEWAKGGVLVTIGAIIYERYYLKVKKR